MKMHVIGDADTVLGFSLVGLTGEIATTAEGVENALEKAAEDSEIGVIFVTEKAAALIPDQIDAWHLNQEGPVVVEILGADGPVAERSSLQDVIARATGVHV
jgi:V/A-type H+-transporting ATPase subunit F